VKGDRRERLPGDWELASTILCEYISVVIVVAWAG
jgi:hypothetical protein